MVGTSRGHLSLFDTRFRLPSAAWQHPGGRHIEAIAPALATPGRLGLRGLDGCSTPLVYVAAGHGEVGLWDVIQQKCHQVRRTAVTSKSLPEWLLRCIV